MDPLCEDHPWESPYAVCGNNFVNRIDPDGMDDVTYDPTDDTYTSTTNGTLPEVEVVAPRLQPPPPPPPPPPAAAVAVAASLPWEQAFEGIGDFFKVVGTVFTASSTVLGTFAVAGVALFQGDTSPTQRAQMQAKSQSAAQTATASPDPNDNKNKEYKKKKAKINNKDKDDIPDWVQREGYRPFKNENGKQFAERVLKDKYKTTNFNKGAGSEYSKIQKWVDTHFE